MKTLALVLVFCLVTAPILAQESQPELFRLELLPNWELKEIGAVKFGCYDTEGVRELKRVDIRFKANLEELTLMRTVNAELADALKLRTDISALYQQNIDTLKALLEDKNGTIRTMAEKLSACENSTSASDIILPVVLGGLALVALAFLGGYLVADLR